MTAVACTQPGCGGTIEDGYCAVCGLAPALAATAAALAGAAAQPGRRTPRSPGAAPVAATTPTGSGSGSAHWSAGTGRGGGSGSGRGIRGSRGSSGRSSRGMLGDGLVEVPPVPARDPVTAILPNPTVPENRRFCGNCGHLVGQSRDGRPGLADGFCRHCGARYSFTPKLEPGELVAGQYEILGCLAHGGLGWIYLARDRNVSDRWVVLKGLLNTGDADARPPRSRSGSSSLRSSTRTSSGSTTSSSTPAGATVRAPATSSWNTSAASRSRRSAWRPGSAAGWCPSPTRSPSRSRSCPRSATCTTGGSSTATSSRTT